MNPETKEELKTAARETERAAKYTVRKPWVQMLARIGFYLKGSLFIIIGASAILLAAGLKGGRIVDPVGAMSAISQLPFGSVLLLLFSVGAIGHGLWNILRGVADVDDLGKGLKGIVGRSAAVGVGIFYLILAVISLQIASSERIAESNEQGEQTVAYIFLSIPLGALMVVIIGLGFFGAAAHECYSGLTGKFQENYRSWKLGPFAERIISVLGVISFTTRAALYCFVGYFFLLAAGYDDYSLADGLDGALLALAQSRFGLVLLLVSGFGLLCHGVLALFEAKYRRIC